MLLLFLIVGGIIIILSLIVSSFWFKSQNEIEILKKDIETLQKNNQQELTKSKNEITALQEKQKQDSIKFNNSLENNSLLHIRCDKYQTEIINLKKDINTLQENYKQELTKLTKRLENSSNLRIQKIEFDDIIISSTLKQIAELCNKEYAFLGINKNYYFSSQENNLNKLVTQKFNEAIDEQYKYKYLCFLYPEINNIFNGTEINKEITVKLKDFPDKTNNLFEIVNILNKNISATKELIYLKNRVTFLEKSASNLTAIPYMAVIMADYETYGIEHLAKELDWGNNIQRKNKVASIHEIRKKAKETLAEYKEYQYQLEYLLRLFPNLQDIIDCEFKELPILTFDDVKNTDHVREYISKEEYEKLSETERNQLALDNYKKSHKRSKWQVGRDYELYVGYKYHLKGYDIDYFGSYMGLEDLGRDIIAKKDNKVLIIQCKYWSSKKQIHENAITQLYGTMASYCIENNIDKSNVNGLLITNIQLSDMAKKMADYLEITYKENFEIGDYPCIKCNIGKDNSKIYHLPFDQQYDATKIKNDGEFYAMTVAEAENAGFRRAHKWFGDN